MTLSPLSFNVKAHKTSSFIRAAYFSRYVEHSQIKLAPILRD